MNDGVVKKTIKGPDGQEAEMRIRTEVLNCMECSVEVTWPGEERYDKEKDVMVPVSEDRDKPLIREERCKKHSAKKCSRRRF